MIDRLNQLETEPSWMERQQMGALLSKMRPNPLFIGNVPDALPPFAKAQLEKHTVPPSVYEGRTLAIASSYAFSESPLVVMQERPYDIEISLLNEICKRGGLVTPRLLVTDTSFGYSQVEIQKAALLSDRYSFHPFINTEQFADGPPSSSFFNNKAFMRRLMKQSEMGKFIGAGEEIFVEEEETIDTMLTKICNALNESSLDQVRFKLAESASGLGAFRVDVHQFKINQQYRDQILQQIKAVFGENGQITLGDVVLEEQIDFGNGNYDDYGVRGYIAPNGQFFFLSIGREITDDVGTHVGMGMANLENTSTIGLSLSALNNVKETTKATSHLMYEHGYWGAVNLDIFVDKNGHMPNLIHDFNMRDGDSSAAGAISPILYGLKSGFALDVHIDTESVLNESKINNIIDKLWQHEIYAYATTFLHYPHKANNHLSYAVKLIAPTCTTIQNKVQEEESIGSLEESLNSLGVAQFKIN